MKVLENGRSAATDTKSIHASTGVNGETSTAPPDGLSGTSPHPAIKIPLMAGQRQLWIAQQLDPESHAFNTGGFAVIKGPLDAAILQQAAKACIAETESLRLRFLSGADGPYQSLCPEAGVAFQVIDLSHNSDPFKAAMAWMRLELNKQFKLDQGETFSWALLQLAPEHFIFCAIYHHLVMDGVGNLLLVRRVRHLYEAFLTKTTPKSPTTSSMAALVDFEKIYRSSNRFAIDGDYWRNQLRDPPALISLSRNSKRPTLNWESHCETIWLSSLAAEGLVALADRLRTTLPRLLMGAIAVAVRQLTGSADFLLGMVVTGRSGRFRNIPANVTHVLPLRLQFAGDTPLRDCMQLTAQAMEAANTHKLYQLDDIRNDLGLHPNVSGLLGIEVNIMPFFFSDPDGGLSWSIHNLSLGPVEDLCISVRDRSADGRLCVDFNGNKDRYDRSQLAEIASQFEALLVSVASASPETALSQIFAPEVSQPNQAIQGSNPFESTSVAEPVPRLFEAQVDRTPQAIALTFEGQSLSYESLDAAANQVSRSILARGLGTEDVIALLLPRGIELVVCMLGIMKAGAAYLPLDADHPAARLSFMLQDSRACLVVTSSEIQRELPLLSSFPLLVLDDPQQKQQTERMSPGRIGAAERLRPLQVSSLLYVIYTSGSSGQPKGVAIEHKSFSLQMQKMVRRIPMRSDETLLGITTVTFDPAAFEILLPLLQGAHLKLLSSLDSRDPVRVASTVAALGGCVLQATPTFWRALFSSGIPRTVRAFVGGEALPADLVGAFLEFPEAINLYGPTETTVDSSFHTIVPEDAERAAVVTIGRPLEGERFYILDESLAPVAAGAAGELYIAGSGLARGYLNRPDLTRERFVNCPFGEHESLMYRTGDLARWRTNGEVDYLGRADQQVKIAGVRIEPGEVEGAVLRSIPAIRECVVVARELRGRMQLVAYYTAAAGDTVPAARELRAALSQSLPDSMLPGNFVRLEIMPMTVNGKLDRKALPQAIFGLDPGRFLAPATPEESVISAVFAEVTGAERVSRDDDFFQLGGNSLAAVLCVHRLQREFHSGVTLRQLFEAPTPEALARSIHQGSHPPASTSLPASTRPVLFLLPGVCGDEPRLVRFRSQCDPSIKFVLLTYPDWGLMIDRKAGASLLMKHLIEQIKNEPFDGPIRLLGYSFGGYCSHAIAIQLEQVGREVQFVGLLDVSALPERPIMLSTQLQHGVSFLRASWFLFQDVGRLLRAVQQREFARVSALVVVRWLNRPFLRPLFSLASRIRRRWLPSWFDYYLNHYFRESTRVAAMDYWYKSVGLGPLKLRSPAVLFRSEDHLAGEPEDLGWHRYFNSVSIIQLNGTHHTILDPPQLALLCEETRKLMSLHSMATREDDMSALLGSTPSSRASY